MEPLTRRENRVVLDALEKRFAAAGPASDEATANAQAPDDFPDVDLCAAEFGFVEYRLQTPDKDTLLVSLAVPSASAASEGGGSNTTKKSSKGSSGRLVATLPPEGTEEALAAAGLGEPLASLQNKPEKGFTLTLKFNLSHLPEAPDARRALASKIASIRAVVMGQPLRTLLQKLADGTLSSELQPSNTADSSEASAPSEAGAASGELNPEAGGGARGPPLTSVVHRPGQAFFAVVQSPSQLLVVHPLHFPNPQDIVLVASFLEALRKSQQEQQPRGSGSLPPECTIHPPSTPPPNEVKHAPSKFLQPNAGFVTFAIRREHVSSHTLLERTCWSMLTFHAGLAAHVKGTRAFLHSRTRRRVEAMTEALFHAHGDERADSRDTTR